jgi:penicillin-binding protein-related factor A (putative recombinase)
VKKPRDNVAIGRLAQAVGGSFEDFVERQHEMAQRLGILAHVVHNQAQSKVVRGRLMFVAKGVADYTGMLVGGTTFCAEAKSTSAKSLARKAIDTKQAEHLDAVARAGGHAFLLVEFRIEVLPLRLRFAVPWLEVPWVVKRSAKSVSADALEKWKIQPGTCYLSTVHPGGPPVGVRKGRVYARE